MVSIRHGGFKSRPLSEPPLAQPQEEKHPKKHPKSLAKKSIPPPNIDPHVSKSPDSLSDLCTEPVSPDVDQESSSSLNVHAEDGIASEEMSSAPEPDSGFEAVTQVPEDVDISASIPSPSIDTESVISPEETSRVSNFDSEPLDVAPQVPEDMECPEPIPTHSINVEAVVPEETVSTSDPDPESMSDVPQQSMPLTTTATPTDATSSISDYDGEETEPEFDFGLKPLNRKKVVGEEVQEPTPEPELQDVPPIEVDELDETEWPELWTRKRSKGKYELFVIDPFQRTKVCWIALQNNEDHPFLTISVFVERHRKRYTRFFATIPK